MQESQQKVKNNVKTPKIAKKGKLYYWSKIFEKKNQNIGQKSRGKFRVKKISC